MWSPLWCLKSIDTFVSQLLNVAELLRLFLGDRSNITQVQPASWSPELTQLLL